MDSLTARNALSVKEKQVHLFCACPKTQFFWSNFKVWLQSCQVFAKETTLEPDTALGLRPDSSKHKVQINFCCLTAKYYIWLCRQKKCSQKLKDFLLYFKHIYEMEKKYNYNCFKKVGASVAIVLVS